MTCPQWATLAFTPQVFVTGMLQLCLFAITDKMNSPALQGTEALVIGVLVAVLGISLGMNSGYAINPSRDLPPRFFTFIAGWGKQVFRYNASQPPFQSAFWGSLLAEAELLGCTQESPSGLGGEGAQRSSDADPDIGQ